jgi:hypothetical protein
MAILVYGSLVPDIVFTVPRLPQAGEDVPARSVTLVAAGGGGNVAVALAAWGYDVVTVGNSVGPDPLGRWVAEEFAGKGILLAGGFVNPDGVTAAGLADELDPVDALERAADVAARYVATDRDSQVPPLATLEP